MMSLNLSRYFRVMTGPYLQPVSKETLEEAEEAAADAKSDLVFVECPLYQEMLQVSSMAACPQPMHT